MTDNVIRLTGDAQPFEGHTCGSCGGRGFQLLAADDPVDCSTCEGFKVCRSTLVRDGLCIDCGQDLDRIDRQVRRKVAESIVDTVIDGIDDLPIGKVHALQEMCADRTGLVLVPRYLVAYVRDDAIDFAQSSDGPIARGYMNWAVTHDYRPALMFDRVDGKSIHVARSRWYVRAWRRVVQWWRDWSIEK